jgi:hypothetical protein
MLGNDALFEAILEWLSYLRIDRTAILISMSILCFVFGSFLLSGRELVLFSASVLNNQQICFTFYEAIMVFSLRPPPVCRLLDHYYLLSA